MDKIKIFKEKALPIEVDIMQDYYPGDPQYIGRESDEKTAESLKKHAAENNIELPDIDGIVFHYYPIYTPESQMELYYNDALFSAPDMSLDYLRSELRELEAYSYKELFDALDVLSSRFSNEEIMCRDAKLDVKRFKNIFYKQFKQRLHITGRVTSYFIGCLKKEMRLKEKYLEMLINKVRDIIDIKLENAEKMAEPVTLKKFDLYSLHRALNPSGGSYLNHIKFEDKFSYNESNSRQEIQLLTPDLKESKERSINKDKLSTYFKPKFKGMGRCENDFEKLCEEVETITKDYAKKRIGKKIAQIALLIYNSEKLNSRKPEYFIDWHRLFCDCFRVPYTKYFPADLEPLPKNLIELFIYLK